MKNYIAFLLVFITTFYSKSQVVFCPPGAEWHYAFKYLRMPPYTGKIFNQQIKYVRDSIIGQNTFKVLKHDRFFLVCDFMAPYHSTLTLIKQSGDTIFFRNINTNHTWQILYNFNCNVGQTWETTIYEDATTVKTYTTAVQSTTTTMINGVSLKQLSVSPANTPMNQTTLTERLGYYYYLFLFTNSHTSNCDFDMFYSPICYQDNSSFGLYKYSNMDCNYYDEIQFTSIKDEFQNTTVSCYPNPAIDKLSVEILTPAQKPELRITDILGKEVLTTKPNFINSKTELDLSALNTGIYFLKVFDNGKLIASKKLIKE